jgi:hypothetical protein
MLEYAEKENVHDVCTSRPVNTHEYTPEGLDIGLKQRVRWLLDVIKAVIYLHEQRETSRSRILYSVPHSGAGRLTKAGLGCVRRVDGRKWY